MIDPRACRVCGCMHSFTIYTRVRAGGRVARRRQCRHCGHRFTTVEVTPDRVTPDRVSENTTRDT